MQFEFADAEVAACHIDGAVLTVRFAAARVQESPRDAPQWMPLTLVAEGVHWESATLPEAVVASQGRLHDGLVVSQGGLRLRRLPVPFDSSQEHRLELEFAQGLHLRTTVQRLQVLPPACQQAVGAYQC